MARKSAGDKKLDKIVSGIKNDIEKYEGMVAVLKEQLKNIENACEEYDNGLQKDKAHAGSSEGVIGTLKETKG